MTTVAKALHADETTNPGDGSRPVGLRALPQAYAQRRVSQDHGGYCAVSSAERGTTAPVCATSWGIDLGREPVPDATTLLKFRRLLNANKLDEALFAQVGQELQT